MKKSLETKISIISRGLDYDYEMFEKSSEEYYENTYGYCVTNAGVKREHRVPQVLHLDDDLVVSVLRRDGSPWGLKFADTGLKLLRDGEVYGDVGLPDPLPFFGKTLSDGVKTEAVLSAYGAQTPGYFIFPDCYYFAENKPCAFCSLRTARRSVGKDLTMKYTRQRMFETTEHVLSSGWDIPMITNTCGTPRTDKLTRRFVLEPLKGIKDACDAADRTDMQIHLLAHPPEDLSVLDEYKAAGVTSIALNIEVYDRKHFAEICPGKDQLYGYDRWWEALEYAKGVFGDWNFYCGIVWGIEPLQASMDGMEDILSRGIGLATNVFHADPGTAMENHPQPSEEEITALAQREHELYQKFPDARTIYDVSMRNTIDWEVHNGYMAQ